MSNIKQCINNVIMYKRKKGVPLIRSSKTVIDGIKFDSILESKMYLLLKDENIKFNTHKTFVINRSFNYGNYCYERIRKKHKHLTDRRIVRKMVYTIDFVGINDEWMIEVKGRPNESFPIRWKLFKIEMDKKEPPPLLFVPSTLAQCKQVVEIIKKLKDEV